MTKKDDGLDRRSILLSGASLFAFSMVGARAAQAAAPVEEPSAATAATAPPGSKPNIVVIFGDDVGLTNVSLP